MPDANNSEDIEPLLEHLKHTRAFDFTAYKRATLARRIEKRMQSVGVGTYPEYLDYLQVHQDEFAQLFNAILINVTAFFRDTDTFDFIRTDVIPRVVASASHTAHDGQIRIWSAGCASGEECYSIAMLLAEAIGVEGFRERVKIYATDIDEEALTQGRHASYTERQVEAVPAELRQRYFDVVGDRWVFKKDLRRNVIFGRNNLLDDAPIPRVDLLLCRNTLMYFNQEAQARIVNRFHFALRPGGMLVLGRAEMLLNLGESFEPIDLKHRMFTKVVDETGRERQLGAYQGREERGMPQHAAGRLRDLSFDQDSQAQIVIDSTSHIALANMRARELFGIHPRDIGRPLQDLEVSYRPVDLRSCIDEAHARRQSVHLRDIQWPSRAGEGRFFNVLVMPMFDAAETTLGTKIIFTDITRQHELQDELQRSRQELETAYEELQSTNEELETTNEELQSTVEELETTNEELQSTNEELETMNEELQSTNDELQSLNEELRRRGIDLSRLNLFLGGILRNVPLGVVVVDDDLRVELWNDVAADYWGLRTEEVKGKHFFALDIGLPIEQLKQPLAHILKDPEQRLDATVDAVNRRGRKFRVRIQGASTGLTDEGHGAGVIMLMQEAPAQESARVH